LVLGRTYGRENLELAMTQALSENRADAERVRQLVDRTNFTSVISSAQSFYTDQVRVILPDLSRFDQLRLVTASGGGL